MARAAIAAYCDRASGLRSPQDEDHEAGIEAIKAELEAIFRDYGTNLARVNPRDLDVIALRLSRVSPSPEPGRTENG